MPHDEVVDVAAWVAELERWLIEQLGDPQLVAASDQRLRAIAITHFEIACMALAKAVKKART